MFAWASCLTNEGSERHILEEHRVQNLMYISRGEPDRQIWGIKWNSGGLDVRHESTKEIIRRECRMLLASLLHCPCLAGRGRLTLGLCIYVLPNCKSCHGPISLQCCISTKISILVVWAASTSCRRARYLGQVVSAPVPAEPASCL